jgi:hypothetical protein
MPRQSLAARAVMAVLLTIGFYALALGIVAALLGAVYAELVYADRILLKPTIFAIVAAGMIVWSILPRIDRFAAPGPRLDEPHQPDLFAVLRDVSAATGEVMPSEVYLLGGEVNAWVAQRGGLMGIGSRRVMAVGLPLLESASPCLSFAPSSHTNSATFTAATRSWDLGSTRRDRPSFAR